MKRLGYLFYFSILFLLITLLFITNNVFAETELSEKYMTLQDQQGKLITCTVHQIVVGDEYLDSQNNLYRVVKLHNNTAIVKLVRKEKLTASTLSELKDLWSYFINGEFLKGETKVKGPIAIYHTHSDESYIPGDGTSSKFGHGGIFQVGDSLTNAFEKSGIPVVHSKTPHDPHDAMAYDRSRRTAVQLLKRQPTTLLDVHRDAVPPQLYSDVIRNQGVTKVQLVVGRQNPNFQANNDFAKRIKETCDRKYPGFIKGIFYGKGKYNQDLGPRSILLEFGSDTNSKTAAERGAQIFAAAAKDVLYGNRGAGFINRGSMRSLFWIIAALVAGVGLFFLINRGSFKNFGKELTGAMGEGENKKTEEGPLADDKAKENDHSHQKN
ncbi:MAG TPA: stage II sporulation protein P [Firmicutes bacterium]|jgi:stage II sporulation protein P|nr:stage II sporulation protein P [Bacillota bacterium]